MYCDKQLCPRDSHTGCADLNLDLNAQNYSLNFFWPLQQRKSEHSLWRLMSFCPGGEHRGQLLLTCPSKVGSSVCAKVITRRHATLHLFGLKNYINKYVTNKQNKEKRIKLNH